MRVTGEGFPSSPPMPTTLDVLQSERGVVVSEPNLGVPLDETVEEERTAPMLTPPGVRTGVVAGPARSNGWKVGVKVRLEPPGVKAMK